MLAQRSYKKIIYTNKKVYISIKMKLFDGGIEREGVICSGMPMANSSALRGPESCEMITQPLKASQNKNN